MNEEFEELATLYTLGLLSWEESAAFEEELWADVDLQLLVQELQETVEGLACTPTQTKPAASVRAKLLAQIRGGRAPLPSTERPARPETGTGAGLGWLPWAIAAALAVFAGFLALDRHQLKQQEATLSAQAATIHANLEKLQAKETTEQQELEKLRTTADAGAKSAQLLESLQTQKKSAEDKQKAAEQKQSAAEAELASLRDKAAEAEKTIAGLKKEDALSKLRIATLSSQVKGAPAIAGSVAWDNDQQRGIVTLEKLPKPGPAQDYQLWIIDPHYTQPVSGGLVHVDEKGGARLVFKVDVPIKEADKFAVSRERKGGASGTEGPGPIVLMGQ